MSYRLIDANALAFDYQEVNDMPCIYADLPNGLDDGFYDLTRAERTCNIIGFDDGVDEGIDGEWHQYAEPQYDLSCGHSSQGTEAPNYCPSCGAKVIGGNE